MALFSSNNPTDSGSIGYSRAARVQISYDPAICNTALRFKISIFAAREILFLTLCVSEAIFAFLARRVHVFVVKTPHFLNPVRFDSRGSKSQYKSRFFLVYTWKQGIWNSLRPVVPFGSKLVLECYILLRHPFQYKVGGSEVEYDKVHHDERSPQCRVPQPRLHNPRPFT